MSWARDEFGTIELGDQRLNKRAVLLAERLAQQPGASIPGACGNWAETAAAYRFLSHDQVGWEEILTAHAQASQARIREHAVVLCLQDTTELDYNGQAMSGLGPLSYEAQRGLYLHPTYVVSPEREPLGVTNAWTWAREFKKGDAPRGGLLESVRWVESYERIAEQARALPGTRHVCVGDRESDILALLLKARELEHAADYLVRCQHNRVLPEGGTLWEQVMAGVPLGRVRFEIPAGRGRKARTVEQELRAERVSLPDRQGGTLEVTCLIATEIQAPAGSPPVCWRLLTNRTVPGLEEAVELLDWYRARWEIELFFLVLKEGCRVERLQLADTRRLQSALALYMVIAWRINRLMRLGRSLPDLPADMVFEADEWRAAFILNKKPIPKTVPALNTVLRLIAQRGGFLARRHDGEPGAKTIWLGLQQVAVFVEGMRHARQMDQG
ncbi:MAG: IS4 family transposase [Proteobacteria bacterium]|nr:IS4 family transposase [Pseudomonadota bacterium]